LFSNFPAELSQLKGEDELTYLEAFNDFKEMTQEEREASLDNKDLLKMKMDKFEMPSTINKLIKSI